MRGEVKTQARSLILSNYFSGINKESEIRDRVKQLLVRLTFTSKVCVIYNLLCFIPYLIISRTDGLERVSFSMQFFNSSLTRCGSNLRIIQALHIRYILCSQIFRTRRSLLWLRQYVAFFYTYQHSQLTINQVQCALEEWETGSHNRILFSTILYEEKYRRILSEIDSLALRTKTTLYVDHVLHRMTRAAL